MSSKLPKHNPPSTAKSETSNTNITVTKQSLYSGPLPHPDLLKKFKEIDESYPERIFKMTERYQEADVKALDRTSRANFIVPILGQVFTLIIALSGIGAGVFLALKATVQQQSPR